MPRLLVAILLALAAFPSAAAAEVELGPEVPVTPPVTTTAPFDQHLAGVASNGRDFLAIWFDRRSSVLSLPNQYGVPVYASRLDAAGRPGTPFGIKLIDFAYGAALVRTASAYVLIWSPGNETDFMLLDDDGNPISAPKRLTDGYVLRAASNGNTIFVIHGAFSGAQSASVFKADGTPLSDVALDANNHYPPSMRPFVMPDGSYGFVPQLWTCPGNVPCVVEPTLTTVSESGRLTTKPLGPVEQRTQSAAAIGNGRLLLAWVSSSQSSPRRSVAYRIYDSSGNPLIFDRRTVDSTDSISTISEAFGPSVGWDGRQFMIAWQWPSQDEQSGQLREVRVSADGVPLDLSPVVVSNTLGLPPWFASNGIDRLVLWDTAMSQSSDIAVRSVPSFDAFNGAPTRVLPQSAALQRDVRIATIGTSRLAVWREGEPLASIVAATEGRQPILIAAGTTLDQQAPAVAASRDQYLVVWREPGSTWQTPGRILGKRIRPDGTVLDADPIVLAADIPRFTFSVTDTVAVASDGANFLVVWIGPNDTLRAARVTAAGAILDSPSIDISSATVVTPWPGTPNSPHVVWNGSVYVVAWVADPSCKLCGAPPGPPYLNLMTLRIDPAGKVGGWSRIASGGLGSHVALARGAGGLMLAWSMAASGANPPLCLSTEWLRDDGTPAGPAHSIECRAPIGADQFPDIDVAWDGGGSYFVAWTALLSATATSARAIHVAADGTPRDAAPFEVAPGTLSFQPSVATAGKVIVAYGRIANEPQYGGVSRAFVRTFDPSAPFVRRRATSR